MHKDLKTVLTKMNADTKYEATEYSFRSKILTGLSIKDKAKLIDERLFLKSLRSDKQMVKKSIIKMGKFKLVIDNKSGEIVSNNKPFYKTWSSLMKKLGEALSMFNVHYNDVNVVKKSRMGIEGFTQKVFEKLQQYL
ncbi:hypothetical protein DBY21_03640 [Candidatus Gastranaerophilales bacterium]|nr:MAG: hypothetical protein DBY21_03640 [Candidatus Gastranaerophilales bacterium]